MADREIIDLTPEKPDEGKIRYTYSGKPQPPQGPDPFWGLVKQVLGLAIGVGIFLLLLFFFVYVILPIIAIVLVWMFLRNLFRKA